MFHKEKTDLKEVLSDGEFISGWRIVGAEVLADVVCFFEVSKAIPSENCDHAK